MSNSPQYELNSTATKEKISPLATEITSKQLAYEVADAADNKKASDIVLLIFSLSQHRSMLLLKLKLSVTPLKNK